MAGRPRIALAAALLAAAASAAAPAAANGVFPTADQLVVDPADPARLAVRTTYGVLVTSDGGAAWDWICEPAVGYQGGGTWHPPIAATAGGAILAALQDGLGVSSSGGCAWAHPADLAGRFVIDLSVERAAPARAVAIVDGENNTLWETESAGAAWSQAGSSLAKGFRATTVDVAPSDPQRVYVSGLRGPAGAEVGWLARTSNRGQTWDLLAIPGSDAASPPYIGAVDPGNADVVYVRLAGAPGRLLVTSTAGDAWAPAFDTQGFVRAFAISPDGVTVVVGSDVDGVWRAPSATLEFEKVSTIAPRCFTWSAAGLYACATELLDGFTVGLSVDAGGSFAPLLRQPCIRGPLACDASTPAGAECPALWPETAMLTGHTDCAPDGGPPPDGGPGGGGHGGAGGAGPGAGGPSAGPGGGSAAGGTPSSEGGCGCRLAAEGQGGAALALAAAMLAAWRRRRTRSQEREERDCTGRRGGGEARGS